MQTITVKIADMQVASSPDRLVTYALGSCIGICIYDPLKKIGALGHIMLPGDTPDADYSKTPHKFAVSCIPDMVSKLTAMGCSRSNMVAKIAGGASLVQFTGGSPLGNIGERNLKAVKEGLRKAGINLIAEDTGLDYARTLYLNTEDGSAEVKTYGKGVYKL